MKQIRLVILVLVTLFAGCSEQRSGSPVSKAPDSTKAGGPAEDWLATTRRERALSPHPIPQSDVDRLRSLRFKNPIRDIIADLQRHPEVLPFQPPKGGSQFGFYDSTQIRILTDDWVYAYTEDGHVARPVLLRYRVQEGGQIEWKVIATDGGE